MAKKRKRRRIGDNVLLPYVSDEAAKPNESALSDEARRANEKVDSLIRDLFGEQGRATAAVALAEREEQYGDGIVGEVRESEQDFKPNAEGALEAEPLSAFSEGDENAESATSVFVDDGPEEELTLKEQIESSTEDFRLLLDMDYEDELGNAIGFEKIRAYHERGLNGRDISRARRRGRAESKEFEMQSQDMQLRRSYAKRKTGLLLRLAASGLLLLLVLIYERADWMARFIGGPLDGIRYPVSYILIGLQLLLLSAAICYKPLCDGLSRLLRFTPGDYSLFSVVVIATLLYHLVLLFIPHEGYPVLYLSPAAFCLCALSGVEFLNWYRESIAFDVVSARRQKYALLGRVSVGNRANGARERLQDADLEGKLWHITPIGFVRNYFANTDKRMESHRNFGALVLLLCGVSASLGLYTFAAGKAGSGVWATVFFAFLLCTPAVSLLFTSAPMFFAALLRLRGKSAIIGEEPIAACGEPATLVLPDHEIFSSMEHEHLRLAPECDAHRVSVLLRALLEKLHSPLSEAFGVDEDSRIDPAALTFTEIAECGVAVEIADANITVHYGTVEYLEERGIVCTVRRDLPPELARRRVCVAVNGIFAAVFAVRYVISSDVPQLLRELDRADVRLTVRSKDPCVRNEVLEDVLPSLSTPVLVSKPDVRELELRTDRVDATVVALGSCKEVARAYVACRRVRRVGAWGKFLQALALGAGTLIAGLFALLDGIPSGFTVTLWMLLWCAFYALLSYLFLRPSLDEDEA